MEDNVFIRYKPNKYNKVSLTKEMLSELKLAGSGFTWIICYDKNNADNINEYHLLGLDMMLDVKIDRDINFIRSDYPEFIDMINKTVMRDYINQVL